MKKSELRERSANDLGTLEGELARDLWKARFTNFTNQLDDTAGVLVIGVQPGFPADVAGLSRGDIITKINRRPVDSLATIQAVHTAYIAKPVPVLVEARRNREVALYVLKP